MVAYNEVMVANLAFGHLSISRTIESLNETTREAKTMKLHLPHSTLETLEAFDWNFARLRIALAVHGTAAPSSRWAYRYQYPSNCAALRYLENPISKQDDPVPFEIEAVADERTVLTDLDDAVAIYTRDDPSPIMYTAHFVEALSVRLAYNTCKILGGKRADKIDLEREFKDAIMKAAAHNANERIEEAPRDADWIRGRA